VHNPITQTYILHDVYINHCSLHHWQNLEDWETLHTRVEKNCDDNKTFICFLVQKHWQVASHTLKQLLRTMTVDSTDRTGTFLTPVHFISPALFCLTIYLHSHPFGNHFHFRKPKAWCSEWVIRFLINDGTAFISTVLERHVMFSIAFGFTVWKGFVQNYKGGIFNREWSEMCL